MTLAGPVIHLAPARHWMPEIPKFRPPGPEPHFLIGNFPLGSRDPLGLLATWAHQFGDIFYYRAGWIHVYFVNHPDHIESVLLTHHQNFSADAGQVHQGTRTLGVRSRSAVFRYKGRDVDVQKAGRDLGVTTLLTGRVTQRGDTIQVSAELTSVRENTQLWGEQYSRKRADIISLQQQISGDIAEKLRSRQQTNGFGHQHRNLLLQSSDRHRSRLRSGVFGPDRLRLKLRIMSDDEPVVALP